MEWSQNKFSNWTWSPGCDSSSYTNSLLSSSLFGKNIPLFKDNRKVKEGDTHRRERPSVIIDYHTTYLLSMWH